MTMEELATAWENWLDNNPLDEESINNFCNIYATNYEEYMTIYELLMSMLQEN